jgi:hypothetical protein
MHASGNVLDIQFLPERLNDMAGDPYWVDLTVDEARRLYTLLKARFAATPAPSETGPNAAALTLTLD